MHNKFKVVLLLVFFFWGCVDILSSSKKILGNYYLVEIDTKDNLSIKYKTKDGDLIGRIPAKVIAYAIVGDSLIAAKVENLGNVRVFILDIRHDSDYAESEKYLRGPFREEEIEPSFISKVKFVSTLRAN